MAALSEMQLAERLTGFFAGSPYAAVSLVYLFGSHAERRAHRESDVDIAVLFDVGLDPGERFELRLRLAGELMRALGRNDVDLVVLNEAPPLFARRILYEGVCIFQRDPVLARSFERDVQLRAADLEPFLRRFRRTKLEALVR